MWLVILAALIYFLLLSEVMLQFFFEVSLHLTAVYLTTSPDFSPPRFPSQVPLPHITLARVLKTKVKSQILVRCFLTNHQKLSTIRDTELLSHHLLSSRARLTLAKIATTQVIAMKQTGVEASVFYLLDFS
jgi:hypothetical protein